MAWRHGPPGIQRKRTLSSLTDDDSASSKRLRRQSTLTDTPVSSLSPGPSRSRSFFDESDELSRTIHSSPRRPRLSAASSSFIYSNTPSRASSIAGDAMVSGLMRTSSSSDIRRRDSTTPATPTHAPHSAFHVLRSVNTIDYAVTPAPTEAPVDPVPASPVSWSQTNTVVFGRGKRVHIKNMADTEDIAQQLCKVNSGLGRLRLVECGGRDHPNLVALATSNGHVQLWDITAKKMVLNWKMKSVTAMFFGEKVLTVGDEKGTLWHYDPRTKDSTKIKEQGKKVTRHQCPVSKGAWKEGSQLLATGDRQGQVLVWDARHPRTPLDVGEMVSRRRKMQHEGPVTALAWCDWQKRHLVTGDSLPDGKGTIRVWDVVGDNSTSEWPTKIDFDAEVTSLQFSPHIREMLSTHGPGPQPAPPPPPIAIPAAAANAIQPSPPTPILTLEDPFASGPPPPTPFPSEIANSVVVHQFPTMRRVTSVSVATSNIADSYLSPNGHRIVFAVPAESQLKVWEVWGKFKAPKAPSLYEACAIR
ncbi:WD40-repeat-containing domain protein [Trametes elegans]|nr:WD40-repeat-containing domain protein [Trametes elegans]